MPEHLEPLSGTVVVAGDVMIDYNLTVDRDVAVGTRSWREAGKVNRLTQYGGAWLLADLVAEFAHQVNPELEVRGVDRPKPGKEGDVHQTYTVLAPGSDRVWRIQKQQFLGVQTVGDGGLRVGNDDDRAEIVALLDSDLSFDPAEHPAGYDYEEAWPAAIKTDGREPWIIFKTSVPVFDGPLWRRLVDHHARRLIVVMTVEDLRRREIQLLRRLSWERTAQDLVSEMRDNPALRALDDAEHVIVSFGTAGAMLFSRGATPRLVFDPTAMEGEWEVRGGKSDRGVMIGYTTVLAAAITHEVILHPQEPQLVDALPRGIAGMRALFDHGFGNATEPPQVPKPSVIANAALANHAGKGLAIAEIKDASESWSILGDRVKSAAAIWPDHDAADILYERAARVAIFGPERALADVPQLKIGDLFTVDREEIESLRSVKNLLSEYIQRKPSKPFSIAVFGSPGSGKSFGIEEIAKSIGGDGIQLLPFNVTQFAGAEDLHGAFHQVRDVSLRGKIPVVFWDEFDTAYQNHSLGWLRYFIGPMQDGSFQEDQVTHPIGTSIFVFAGGTATSKQEFVAAAPEDAAKRKALKVPDFISRLKGFLDVTGPNRRDEADQHFLIRRAILFRSMIRKHCRDLFRKEGDVDVLQIDPGVLHAFLNTNLYKHGARSLESVLIMSALAGRKHFDSSSLPPESQLALHVETPFERLAQNWKFTHDVVRLEKLAAEAHGAFLIARKGWTRSDIRDDAQRRHDLLREYAELSEPNKESNRASVRWIPKKIESEGYTMAPAGSDDSREMTPDEIERLAAIEHRIWMDRKLAAGYKKGPIASESPKQSPYLVAWGELPDDIRETDREMIRAIPRILKKAGYILVRNPSSRNSGS